MLERNISKHELVQFLQAEAGARLVYHAGNLAADRLEDKQLGRIARTLFEAAEAGVCSLAQKRLSEADKLYIAEHR